VLGPLAKLWKLLRPLRLPLVYAVLTLTVFWRIWTPYHDAQLTWRYDPVHEYWGDMKFQQDTLSEGQLALWNPHGRGGFPVYGDPQPGTFYPPNWPLIGWGNATGSTGLGLSSFKIYLHWIFGAIGMHLFMRRVLGSTSSTEPAAYAAGILFSFTSPKLRYLGSAINWSVAWLPWLMLSIWYFSEKPNARRGVLMGTTLAMILLAGAPAVVLYGLIIGLPLGFYRMWGQLREHWKSIAVAALTTMVWTLPLIASNLQQLAESARETRNFSFFSSTAFTPGHFLTFLVPRLGQGENPYFGGFALLGMGLAIASRKHRSLAWLFLGIAAFSVALALGKYVGVLPALASVLSPFSLFRHAHRYLYITCLAVSVLASLGFSYVLSLEAGERKAQMARTVSWVGGGLSLAMGLAYLISVLFQDKIAANKNQGFGLAFLSIAVFTVLLRLILSAEGRNKTRLAWAVPVLLFVDLWSANIPAMEQRMGPVPSTVRDANVAMLEGVKRDWRIYDDGYLQYRPGVRLGLRDFSGYEDDPLGLSRYLTLLSACKRSPALFGHANVRYLLSRGGKVKAAASGGTLIAPGIWELEKRAPAVYFVPDPRVAGDAKEALTKLRTFDPGASAVVEGAIQAGDSGLPHTIGKITSLEPNRVVAQIETSGAGLIVVAEAYYSPWTATIDGKSTKILPANVMFRGIAVSSAGPHTIVMTLAPARFWWMLPLYGVSMLLLLWACFWHRVRGRKLA